MADSSLLQLLLSRPSGLEKLGSVLGMAQSASPVPLGTTTPSEVGLTSLIPTGSGGSMGNWEQRARKRAMNQYGYTPQDWKALDSIIERESSWNPDAVNPSSGAYGIPQILPSAHPDANLQNDPMGQIKWLLSYIQQRYGGPQQALAFKNENNWY